MRQIDKLSSQENKGDIRNLEYWLNIPMKKGVEPAARPQETLLKGKQNQLCQNNNNVCKAKDKKLNEIIKNRNTNIYTESYQPHINRIDTTLTVASYDHRRTSPEKATYEPDIRNMKLTIEKSLRTKREES